MHCGKCDLIEHCGEPWSDIAICCESRFRKVDIDKLCQLLETSHRKSKKARLNDAYKRLTNGE